jgi:ATP-dependent DNA ligase
MKKTYDTLYCKDNLNNIRIWRQERDGGKYRTIAGIKGSDNLVTSEWTTAIGKNIGKANETTAEAQAESEILSTYKKKLKTGYFKAEKDVDKFYYVEPILAKSYKDYVDEVKFENGQWGCQNKFNGFCMLATRNGLHSRKGERYISLKHIEEALIPFFVKYPNAVLHGEAFNNAMRQQLNEIAKLCRKTKDVSEADLKRSKEIISYYIYDGYFPDSNLGEDSPYTERKAWIDKNVIGKYDFCIGVKTTIIKDKAHLDKMFGEAIEDGQEGLILRKMDMPYVHKRAKTLLKYKPLDSQDGIIISIHRGTGNWANLAAKATIKWKDKTFDATFKGTELEKEEILQNQDKWLNKKVEFLFNSCTGLGIPNFARIDVNNCFK